MSDFDPLDGGTYCANEDHPGRPAYVRLTWPDKRFYSSLECRSCLRATITAYVVGDEDGVRHELLISPLAVTP